MPCHIAKVVAIALVLAPFAAQSSSHREAPAITGSPKVDGTDLFLFMSYEPGREGYVTLIANYYPFQDPFGGPNYFALDDTARYTIHIDNDGDARENLSFVFSISNRIGSPDNGPIQLGVGSANVAVPLKNVGPVGANDQSALNFQERYSVRVLRPGSEAQHITNITDGSRSFTKPYDFVGTKTFGSIQGYESYVDQYIYTADIPGCDRSGKVFVGQRDEPFQINVGKIFDLVNFVPVEAGAVPGLPGIEQSRENDTLANKNITTFALEIHSSCLTGSGNGVIGGWTTAQQRDDDGQTRQVSRLANPLVNELVIGLPDKDRFNRSRPARDARFLTYATNPTLPAILNALFLDAVNDALENDLPTLAPTNLPRNDLVTAFLTGFLGLNQLAKVTPSEIMRLNTRIPATSRNQQDSLGVLGDDLAGFPNGRRPGDDVTDIALRVAMGRLCHPVTIGGEETDLGLCDPNDAPVGTVPFTDGAPTFATDFDARFPYLRTPIPGSADFPALTRQ